MTTNQSMYVVLNFRTSPITLKKLAEQFDLTETEVNYAVNVFVQAAKQHGIPNIENVVSNWYPVETDSDEVRDFATTKYHVVYKAVGVYPAPSTAHEIQNQFWV